MAYDANKNLTAFHDDRVFVNEANLSVARQRRQANRDRLERGLKKDEEPCPQNYVVQGSYAMGTMVQSEVESSDIDDGAVFDREALKGARGGDRTPGDAKEVVRKALAVENKFITPPEVRGNCVRVYYNDGFHVDIPVYRTYEEQGVTYKELASTGAQWKTSAPEDITNWFNQEVNDKSPDDKNGRQMRRVVRLIKFWSKSRASWKMPSGFIISVLVDEAYRYNGWSDRDDLALLAVMRSIRNRLQYNEKVLRPVNPMEEITNDQTYGRVRAMRDELASAIDELSKIERADCDELMALKALKKIFNTDFWDVRIQELGNGDGGGGGGSNKGQSAPKKPIDKQGGTGQYA